jgi:hypothetical protein
MENNKTIKEVLKTLRNAYRDVSSVGYENLTQLNKILSSDTINAKDVIELLKTMENGVRMSIASMDDLLVIDISENGLGYDYRSVSLRRLLFKYNGVYKSIFEILGVSPEEAYNISYGNNNGIFNSVYSYLVFVKRFDLAYKLIDEKIKRNNMKVIIISSDITDDYTPVLNYIIDNNLECSEKLLLGYLRSINKESEYCSNKLDSNMYKKIFIRYKDQLKNLNYSPFFKPDTLSKINIFDMIESDYSSKERIFRVFDNEAARILKGMAKSNPEKTKELVVEYFNNEHPNGRKKVQFMSSFRRVKKILESANTEIDIFKFDVKLQSYILLEIMA